MLFVHNSRPAFPIAAVALALTVAFTGCSHRLEVKNMSLYRPVFSEKVPQGTTLGIAESVVTPEEDRLVLATINALKRNGFDVIYPYHLNVSNREIDYLISLALSSDYKGSGSNFLINWPGFLIWTPAWHGYNYRVIYAFDVSITDMKTNELWPTMKVPVDLDIRHAAMNRTWTEISWLEWSVIAFIGGIVFTRYDKSVTPELLDFAEDKMGDYVGSKITGNILANMKISPGEIAI